MIFVTGGTGLIGSFLLRELRARGLSVQALSRGAAPADAASGIEWIQGDLLDTDLLRTILAESSITHVFHCAGLVSYAPQDEEALLQVNVAGTAALVDACLTRPDIRLGYVSSVAALGSPPSRPDGLSVSDPLVVDEKAAWDLGASHPAYATSKYLGELEVWRGVAEGLSAVIINPSVVLGPGDWNRSSTRLLHYAYEQHLFYTRGLLNFVDVRDVVNQFLRLTLDLPAVRGERFVLNAGSLPLANFFRQAATAFGRKPPTIAVPDWAAEIIWRLEHGRAMLTGARPLITRDTARAGRHPVQYDAAKVQKATGLAFRPLADTITWCATELKAAMPPSEPVFVS
jgi:dihydroflavonol-4-reductase